MKYMTRALDKLLTPLLLALLLSSPASLAQAGTAGLFLVNAGMDAELTPKLKAIGNVNFLWFDTTEVLETFVFQSGIRTSIGIDMSLGLEFRPLLNDNLQIIGGVSGFIPGGGFKDLYSPLGGTPSDMFAGFLEVIATY